MREIIITLYVVLNGDYILIDTTTKKIPETKIDDNVTLERSTKHFLNTLINHDIEETKYITIQQNLLQPWKVTNTSTTITMHYGITFTGNTDDYNLTQHKWIELNQLNLLLNEDTNSKTHIKQYLDHLKQELEINRIIQ